MFVVNKSSLVVFTSVFNILNTKNPESMIYNRDYSSGTYEYYQRRSIYFGCVLSLR